jgi:hypothetical protein
MPPGHPATEDGTTPPTLASLKYPGSEESVNVHHEGEGTVILSTPDPSSKVVDWYVSKLPGAKVVGIPFVGGGVITKDQVSVTVTPGGGSTTIVVAIGKKHK